MVGSWPFIVVIGVMTGFDLDLKKKILSVNAHIIVLKHGRQPHGRAAGGRENPGKFPGGLG